MSTPLEYAFGMKALLGLVQAFSQEERTPCADLFMTGMKRTLRGKQMSWDRRDQGRQIAAVGDHSAPAVEVHPETEQHLTQPWIEPTLKEFIPAEDIYINARTLGSVLDPTRIDTSRAEQEIEIVTRSHAARIAKLKEYVACELLFNTGGVTINTTTVPGSKKTFTIDYGTNDFTVGADWSTAGTNILTSSTEMPALEQKMEDDAGFEIGRMLFGRNVNGYFLGNTEIKEWVGQTQFGARAFTTADLGMLELQGIPNWVKLTHTYKNDGDANAQKFVDPDSLVALPQDLGGVLGWATGYSTVPQTAIGSPVPNMIGVNEGLTVYAEVDTDPPGIWIYTKEKFVPVILHPEAVIVEDDVTTT